MTPPVFVGRESLDFARSQYEEAEASLSEL